MSDFNYQIIMLCKSININYPNTYTLKKFPMNWEQCHIFLDSLALQGHDLKNIAVYNNESKSLRFYEPNGEYNYIEATVVKQISLPSLPTNIEDYKSLFGITDTDFNYY